MSKETQIYDNFELRRKANECALNWIPKEIHCRKIDIYNKKREYRNIIETHLRQFGLNMLGLEEIEIPIAYKWKDPKLDKDEGIYFLFQWNTPQYRYCSEKVGTMEVNLINKCEDNDYFIFSDTEEEQKEIKAEEQQTQKLTEDDLPPLIEKLMDEEMDEVTDKEDNKEKKQYLNQTE